MKKSSVTPAAQSPVQQQSFDISDQQRQAQAGQIGTANQSIAQSQQGLSPFLAGSAGQAEAARGLTGQMTSANAQQGENAIAASRARAQAAGFGGGGQPLQFGAETGLANQTAARAAQIPAQVEQQLAPQELQAAGLQAQTGSQQGSLANIYNPQSYYGAGTQLAGQNYTDYLQQLQQQRQKKGGIWGTLAKVAGNVGGSFIGDPGLGSQIGGAAGF